MKNTVVGIAWYRPENYIRLRKLFVDGNKLPKTYNEWLVSAEKAEETLKDSGIVVIRVDIDPNTFPAWCLAKGMRLDEKARSRFASEAALQNYSRSIDSVIEDLT